MAKIRIAVASTPLTATLEEAVPAAVAAVEEAGRLDARIVCLPETGLPGHGDQNPPARAVARDAPAHPRGGRGGRPGGGGVVAAVGAAPPPPAGREIVSFVID